MEDLTPEHVAAVLETIRDLTDERGRGKATRRRIALAALASVDVAANPDLARDVLAAELETLGSDLLAEVTTLEAGGAVLDADAGRLFWLDLALVRVLERVDPIDGADARAGRLESSPEGRCALWADPETPSGLVLFARVVWSLTVEDRWRRGVVRPAALVRVVFDPLNRLASGGTFDEVRFEMRDARGERLAVRKGDDPDVAAMPVEVVRRCLTAWRSTTARRLVRFLALEAHAGEVRGDLRPEKVRVAGGLFGTGRADWKWRTQGRRDCA